jgi:glycosyltransferase involved in cell wall biosynthesis
VWTDRVESSVTRFHAAEHRGARRAYRLINAFLMRHLERYVIRRAWLGLFHGMDCFAAYSRWCANPHLVHDVHLPPSMRIPPELLEGKRARPASERPTIVYVGRAHQEKGIYDWIEALRRVEAEGHSFKALWCGSGPELEQARQRITGFSNPVEIRDNVPHAEAIALLREADLLLFCHKTPESPRCLVEALVSGTPIVGYASPYPEDLVHQHGGGVLTPPDDVAELSRTISELLGDRARLADLARRAARDGEELNDEAVFEHRARLMATVPLHAAAAARGAEAAH